ncbi:glutamate receptor 2-like isoform X2 [Gordionus sp. m RMFG-2023]|uniref:glutamate receptor 2-like isoform X2 n=1 Tax=Gordionus sp. m RMFG-2023 TaxID=3053472 RepID=UPI0031FC763A
MIKMLLIYWVLNIKGAILDQETYRNDVNALKHGLTIHNMKKIPYKFVAKIRIINSHDPYNLTVSICQLLKDGVFSVHIGLLKSQNALQILRSFHSHLHIPSFESKLEISGSEDDIVDKEEKTTIDNTNNFTFYLHPFLLPAIADLIRYYRWERFIYFYDDDEGFDRFQILTEHYLPSKYLDLFPDRILAFNKSNFILKRLSPSNQQQIKLILRDIIMESSTKQFIILDYPYHSLKIILHKFMQMGMTKGRYHYILMNMDIEVLDLSEFIGAGANISGFTYYVDNKNVKKDDISTSAEVFKILDKRKPKNYTMTGQAAALIDGVFTLSGGIKRLLHKSPNIFGDVFKRGQIFNNGSRGVVCLDVNDWSNSHIHNIINPWLYGSMISEEIKKLNIHGISGNISLDQNGRRNKYQLSLIEMTINRGLTKVGTWNAIDGIKFQYPKFNRYTGNVTYNNRTRIITSIFEDPYFMTKVPRKGEILRGNDKYEGFCLELADMIAKMVGFDYIIRPVKDGKYGAIDENNQWNGVVGELIRQEADLAVAPLTITSARERVIDFSKPFMDLGISIMVKKPTQHVTGIFSFLNPLSNSIWTCIILGYVSVSVVMYLVSRFNPDEWKLQDNVFTNDFTLSNCFWFVLGAFMQQGCDINPRSLSGRSTASVWWFFTLIMISSYTANLAAFLTVERMNSPINNVDDLSKQTEIKYGTLDAGSTKAFFHTSKVSVYEKMWQFMSTQKPSVFVKITQEGIDKVRKSKGKYAYLLESTTNDYTNNRKPCDTIKVGDNLDSKGYGVATPLDSDLREAITFAVLKLREDGDLQKLKNKWWYDKGECGPNTGTSDIAKNELTLSNVAGIFYILIGGLCISLIMAILEFVFRSRSLIKQNEAKRPMMKDLVGKMDPSFTSTEASSTKSNKKNWFKIQV